MKENGNFPDFECWGEKYGAFTCFYKGKERFNQQKKKRFSF